jgi:hypothetical protein
VRRLGCTATVTGQGATSVDASVGGGDLSGHQRGLIWPRARTYLAITGDFFVATDRIAPFVGVANGLLRTACVAANVRSQGFDFGQGPLCQPIDLEREGICVAPVAGARSTSVSGVDPL